MLEDTTHDTVAARVNLQTYLLLALANICHLINEDLAILECKALGHLLHIGTCEGLVECHLIDLLLLERGVCQLTCNVTIVGKEQQSE